ncbi:MAG TPA: sulfurtransferase TusA family protein [Aquifex aeolicus]|uniref:Sulfurtransferase TusA family protein n=1 Tax=Aquifex aeolicus TaxID=63363 RepID=A0A7C5QLJ0_AQUAO|nr:sulfurtransferase TusA family protein [Aquifex aeolicus]
MKIEDIKPDVVHDVTGTYCPVPVVETSVQIRGMKIGQILELIADDPGSVEDIPAWCRSTGQEFLGMFEEDGEFHFFIRKVKEVK